MRTIRSTPLLKLTIGLDLAVTGLMSMPGLSDLFVAALDLLGRATGTAQPLPPFDALHMLILNLAGVLGVAWNAARWYTASFEMARMDAAARLVVAALILYYVLVLRVTPVLLLFVLTEIFGSWLQFRLQPAALPDRPTRSASSSSS